LLVLQAALAFAELAARPAYLEPRPAGPVPLPCLRRTTPAGGRQRTATQPPLRPTAPSQTPPGPAKRNATTEGKLDRERASDPAARQRDLQATTFLNRQRGSRYADVRIHLPGVPSYL